MKWKINPTEFEKAKEILGLDYPVRIREADLGFASGKYHGLARRGPTTETPLDEPAHHITISPKVPATMLNEVVWHEMTHAAQCEDYLLEDGDYSTANAGLRQAFAQEMRSIRRKRGIQSRAITSDYNDVSFEEEAREFMDRAKDVKIFDVPDEKKAPKSKQTKKDDPLKGYNHLWRVDMFDCDKAFVGTTYVFANDEWDAKKWARENHMKGMKWSSNLHAHPIHPKGVK